MVEAKKGWTTPAEVVARLKARFDRGEFLIALAERRPFEPIGVPLRGPTAGSLGADLAAVRAWVVQWETRRPKAMRLEHREVGGRVIGTNRLPARAWIDGYDQLWEALGVRAQVERFAGLYAYAAERSSAIAAWCAANPIRTLAHAESWERLVETATWIGEHPQPGLYLRQIDVPGVDTKFVESHRGILADLLEAHLPAERIDTAGPLSDFAARYRFARKPDLVRIRSLSPDDRVLEPFSEITVRAAELAAAPIEANRVFVVENEINFLTLPQVPDAVTIWGGGYAVDRLAALDWLSERELVYWGDIDTHGFAILSRLRGRFPDAESMLMDRTTLTEHKRHWVREPKPIRVDLPHLTPAETLLYRELLEDVHGEAVRLEQERIRFHAVESALRRFD